MEEPKTRKMTLGQFYAVRSTGPITITQTTPAGTFTVLEVTETDGTGLSEVGFTSLTNSAQISAGEDVKYAITPCFNRGAASAQGSAEKIDVDQDYTPESTNPQSGTAVAQALGGYATTQALEERTVVTEVHGSELEDTSQMEGYSISSMTSILGGGNLMPYLTLTKVIVTNNQTCPEDALVQSLRMVVCIPSRGTPGRVYLVPKHQGQGLIGLSTSGNRQSLVGKVYYESPLLTPGGTSELVEVEFLPAGELAPVSWFSTSLWPCTGETAESVLGGAGDKSVAPRLAMQPYSQGNKLKEGYDAYFTFSPYPTRSYTPIKLITGKPLTEAVPAHTDDTTAHLTAEEHAGLTELLENTTGSGGGGGELVQVNADGRTLISAESGLFLALSTYGLLEGEIGALQVAPLTAAGQIADYLAVGARDVYLTMQNTESWGGGQESYMVITIGNTRLQLTESKLQKLAALLA